MADGILGYLKQGGLAIYPLILFSVVGLAIVLERAYFLKKAWQSLKETHPKNFNFLRRGQFEEAHQLANQTFLCRIFQEALLRLGKEGMEFHRAVERGIRRDLQDLRNRVWALGTIGSLAPFVGLFGTVLGIMHAFGEIARTQEGGFTTVSAGIAESLIATAAGLLVGVLAILAYNFYMQQIGQIGAQLKNNAEEMIEILVSAPEKAGEKKWV